MVGRWLVLVGGLCWNQAASADTAHVVNRCSRLTRDEYEELDARVLLLLKAESTARPLPAVVCNDQAAWVEWDNERYALAGRVSLVEEAVVAIETRLYGDAGASRVEDEAIASGQPVLGSGAGVAPPLPSVLQPADRVALRPADAKGGGIALGLETELASDTIAMSMGPAFDFAASVGPVLIGGRESIRFTLAGRRVSFMDFQLLVGYGAPFDPSKRFGVALRGGPEWMVAYPEGNSGQAAVVPVVDLGVRVAHHWGPVGAWLGIDARWRLSPLSLRSRSDLVANDISGSLTVGAAFVDWSRK